MKEKMAKSKTMDEDNEQDDDRDSQDDDDSDEVTTRREATKANDGKFFDSVQSSMSLFASKVCR